MASANGGLPDYIYTWSNGGTTASISNLIAGNYTVTVTDDLNCSTLVDFVIGAPILPIPSPTITVEGGVLEGCEADGITLLANGDPASTYEWFTGEYPGGTSTGDFGPSLTVFDSNSYYVVETNEEYVSEKFALEPEYLEKKNGI